MRKLFGAVAAIALVGCASMSGGVGKILGAVVGALIMGVIAFYFLVLVEASSLMMKKLPRPVWHGIHLTAYISFVLATAHGVYAGTDRTNLFFVVLGSGMAFIVTLLMSIVPSMWAARLNPVEALRFE